ARNSRRFLAGRHAKIIGLPLKIIDEIVGDVDLGDRLAAKVPECFDGFIGGTHLAIKLPVEAAEPLELRLSLADLLGEICLRRRRLGDRESGNSLLLILALLLLQSGNALLLILTFLLFQGGNSLLFFLLTLLLFKGSDALLLILALLRFERGNALLFFLLTL